MVITRRVENGIVSVNHEKFIGYPRDDNGNLVVVLEEAEIVRRILKMYLEGSSILEITRALEPDKTKTVTGKDKWNSSVISRMLINEKHMGGHYYENLYSRSPN